MEKQLINSHISIVYILFGFNFLNKAETIH